MFITETDLRERPSLREDLRNRLAWINNYVKQPGARLFYVGGAAKVAVRLRKPAFGAVSNLGMYDFVGGEGFRLDNITVVPRGEKAGLEILATFCPAKSSLATTIVSMTMPLGDALDLFPGFEKWCSADGLFEGTQQDKERAHERAATESLPSVDETRSSALWGAW